jgi:hypothetical protein
MLRPQAEAGQRGDQPSEPALAGEHVQRERRPHRTLRAQQRRHGPALHKQLESLRVPIAARRVRLHWQAVVWVLTRRCCNGRRFWTIATAAPVSTRSARIQTTKPCSTTSGELAGRTLRCEVHDISPPRRRSPCGPRPRPTLRNGAPQEPPRKSASGHRRNPDARRGTRPAGNSGSAERGGGRGGTRGSQ